MIWVHEEDNASKDELLVSFLMWTRLVWNRKELEEGCAWKPTAHAIVCTHSRPFKENFFSQSCEGTTKVT